MSDKQRLSKSKFRKKVWIWILVFILILGGGGYWFYNRQTNADQTLGMTRWVQAGKGNVEKTIRISGTLNPANQVTLTSSGDDS